MSDTKEARLLLKINYGNMCMLTGLKTKLTYHHTVVKRSEFKKSRNKIKGETIENGALLNEDIHCKFLHGVLERNCHLCYQGTNLLILRYKEAFDNQDWDYVDWHINEVMPVYRNQLKRKRKF